MLRSSASLLLLSVIAIALIGMLQSLSSPQVLAFQEGSCRTFAETGKTVCGKFLSYWQRHGGLAQFGYPLSNAFVEKSDLDGRQYEVQYFERALFELHPENKPPHDVLLAQLGRFRFVAGYSGIDPGEPDEENLPIFPQAQNITVTYTPMRVPDGHVINVTSYRAIAKPEAVVAFYEGIMVRNQWLFVERKNASYLKFVFAPGTQTPPRPHLPVYGLAVELKVVSEGTDVTLRLSKTLPK